MWRPSGDQRGLDVLKAVVGQLERGRANAVLAYDQLEALVDVVAEDEPITVRGRVWESLETGGAGDLSEAHLVQIDAACGATDAGPGSVGSAQGVECDREDSEQQDGDPR